MNFEYDPSWRELIDQGLARVDASYLRDCYQAKDICPKIQHVFSAFSLPKQNVRYILLGESPYPRLSSANGYAFWDAEVGELWSDHGLSKKVNRATSLRNFIKMLLHAQGLLAPPFLAQDIARLSKAHVVKTLDEVFIKLLNHGFLLLNASLIWSPSYSVNYHARHWFPFIKFILNELISTQVERVLLFGKHAQKFDFLPPEKRLMAEHPYVLSFILNQDVLRFFKPFNLLSVAS